MSCAYAGRFSATNLNLSSLTRGVLGLCRKRRASRKYRPTSASAIGEGYNPEWGEDKDRNMTATLNEATLYTKPIPHFPSAYKCDNAHRPVIIADSDPGFFRRTVPSPIAWATK
jgi:hypothetical protein